MKLAAVVAVVGAALTALLVQYFVLIRPWYQGWGATAVELRARLPGDELAPDAREVETRALTIDAPPERVWPWLAQLGQDRAGFYSYGFLQNLFGMDMPRGDRLLGLPDPRPGEKLLMSPRPAMGGRAYAVHERVEPGRALVLRTYALRMMGAGGAPPPSGSWAFVLAPEPDGRTRLVVRSRRGSEHVAPSLAASALGALVLDPLHFAFERRLMLGVKERAEGRPVEPAWREAVEVALWFTTAALGLAALAAALRRRPAAGRWLLAATAALFLFTLLFFARPPVALALLLVVALRFAVAWAWRRPPGEARPAEAARA
ncbi:hypothetical protein [Anaeromyxobacter diazotrophicus]|uniref:Uncharacterized protein n=1 Tax=Anaeromyxobacter diazotrophicus TaxID=2590199 RepID=A0A7I9VQN7_9BACT|nr:hypothetical protein [Anaeromyxobacter diazotrophicus]GEJ58671.1 hypothetical protein AMYX_34120 [Anaeromyxobacter diazotrophicus]